MMIIYLDSSVVCFASPVCHMTSIVNVIKMDEHQVGPVLFNDVRKVYIVVKNNSRCVVYIL